MSSLLLMTEAHREALVSDLAVLCLLGVGVVLGRAAHGNEIWREALGQLWSRRR